MWPEETAADRDALELHGIRRLVRRLSGSEQRDEAVAAAALESLRLIDLTSLVARLHEAGIEPLILKGTALAYTLYPAPELRPRVDVDLLVRSDEAPRTRALLEALGYEGSRDSGDELGSLQQTFYRTDGHGVRHVYDVHYAITNSAVTAGALRYDELMARSVPLPVAGPGARIPSRVDALLYASIHRAVHHYDSERLIWLVDVHLLREAMSGNEHEAFWRLAAERRIDAICRRTVAMTERWFGSCPRGAAPTEPARGEPSAAFLDRGLRRGEVLARDLRALGSWRARARRIWQLAFPPAEFMLRGGSRSRAALPWLYAVRAANGLRRLFDRAN